MTDQIQKVSILTIGDEILIGQTQDTNSSWIAGLLSARGIEVNRILTVSDDIGQIIEGLDVLSTDSGIVLITGGLGPTRDDVTKKALCNYFDDNLLFDEKVLQRIVRLLARFNRKPTDGHREQAFMPSSAELLPNKLGSAPAMVFRKNGRLYISMPGVPYEMKSIMTDSVLPMLHTMGGGQTFVSRTIMTAGEGESTMAASISHIEDGLPDGISLSYLPGINRVRIRVNGRGSNRKQLENKVDDITNRICDQLGGLVYGFEDIPLEKVIGDLLLANGSKMATAESCTGGSVGRKITAIPGSSTYFLGGIIAYDNSVKTSLLGVPKDLLEEHGAVSEETAVAMVRGACLTLGADVGLATTGIAGPGGGCETKPVGTVWIAAGGRERVITKLLNIGKDRKINIEFATNSALNLLRLFLSGL